MAVASKVVRCSCEHKYQDKKYGKGKRIANLVTKDITATKYRCTVCGTERG